MSLSLKNVCADYSLIWFLNQIIFYSRIKNYMLTIVTWINIFDGNLKYQNSIQYYNMYKLINDYKPYFAIIQFHNLKFGIHINRKIEFT